VVTEPEAEQDERSAREDHHQDEGDPEQGVDPRAEDGEQRREGEEGERLLAWYGEAGAEVNRHRGHERDEDEEARHVALGVRERVDPDRHEGQIGERGLEIGRSGCRSALDERGHAGIRLGVTAPPI
jgi:hypothetical protein